MARRVWKSVALFGLTVLSVVSAHAQAGRGAAPKAAPAHAATPSVQFDVVVTVDSTLHTEAQIGSAGVETTDAVVRTSARFPHVGFHIISQDGRPIAVLPIPQLPFHGDMLVSAAFAHHDAPRAYRSMSCDGVLAPQRYDANLMILVLLALGGSTNKMTFNGMPPDAGADFERTLINAEQASCQGRTLTLTPQLGFTRDGVVFASSSALNTTWSAEANGTMPAPLAQLLAGRGFTIDSGSQTAQIGAGQVNTKSVHVAFVPPCPECPTPPLEPIPPLTPTPAPRNPCAPDKFADADRKWKTADELIQKSKDHLKDAQDRLHKWEKEESKTMAELSLEKYDLLNTVELALEEGGAHLLHSAATRFGLATSAAWIYTDVLPHAKEHVQAEFDALKMVDAAAKLAESAVNDFRTALSASASAECEEQRQKLIAREKLLDQAKALRDKWTIDGSALYKENQDDPNEYPMDAGAALKRAIEILSASPPGSTTTRQDLERRAASPQGLRITADQGRAAIVQVDAAIRMMDAGRELMGKRKAFVEQRDADLGKLATNWMSAR